MPQFAPPPVVPSTDATVTALPTVRSARTRHYLMCRPSHFAVSYTINPWMDPSIPVDRELAIRQWESLHDLYVALGHTVSLIEPIPGLPDMVFAANGALVVDGKVLGAKFAKEQRMPEGPAYLDRLMALDSFGSFAVTLADNEGEGDFLDVGDVILAGTAKVDQHRRTAPAAHREAQEFLGKPVISLTLVDPNFYHLDTALTVLGDRDIAYYPPAFSPGSRAVLRRMFPDALIATPNDAMVFGLNSVSDGRHVAVAVEAVDLHAALRARGYEPIPVAMSEFRKSPVAGPSAARWRCAHDEHRSRRSDACHAKICRRPLRCYNYHPLPVVVASASGCWVTDLNGRRYLDCLAAYSALNFGHGHPELLAAAHHQLDRLTLTSRAFDHDALYEFCAELGDLCGKQMVLPMNTGAEAVETAIKVARKWGYRVKGVPSGRATIVVADGNFHGRTTTIVSFSTDSVARDDFGPFTPGFRIVPYGDAAALEAAIDDDTVAVLIEPIQERGGRARAAGTAICARCARSAPGTTCCSSPTRSSPASAGPATRSPATTRASSRTCTCSARRSAAASCRCRPSPPTRTCSACCRPGSMARPSAVTRWPARSAGWSSGCWPAGSTRSGHATWASSCTPG